MINLRTGTLTHFSGCDITAFDRNLNEIGIVGAITWSREENIIAGSLYFSSVHPYTKFPSDYIIEVIFRNEAGETQSYKFLSVKINERFIEEGKAYIFFADGLI